MFVIERSSIHFEMDPPISSYSKRQFLMGSLGLYFLKRSTSALITSGELHFEFIEKIIEDISQDSDFVIVLKKTRV